MKRKFLFVFVAFLILATKGYSQYSFGVSPGFGLNSAYFGYKVDKKIMPFIGFQYINANVKLEANGNDYTPKISGSLYVPNIGVKYYIRQQNKLQSYLTISLSKPLLNAKQEVDNEENEDLNETIDKIRLFGAEFGYGVEYFFDENFSIGGEFGLRCLHLKYSDSATENMYYNENSILSEKIKFNLNPTYSKISLNFYF